MRKNLRHLRNLRDKLYSARRKNQRRRKRSAGRKNKKASEIFRNLYEVADANYSALFNLANNYGVDAKAEIRTLEANNATLNKEIADLDSTYGVLDREQQIARLEVSVANLTAQIDAIQKCMDVIMDQINALIAE